jgi:hypothetical protein
MRTKIGYDDEPTDFVVTKQDLRTLALGLVKEIGDSVFFLHLAVSHSDIAVNTWLRERLARVLNHAPEMAEEFNKLLAEEEEKAEKQAKETLEELESAEKESK